MLRGPGSAQTGNMPCDARDAGWLGDIATRRRRARPRNGQQSNVACANTGCRLWACSAMTSVPAGTTHRPGTARSGTSMTVVIAFPLLLRPMTTCSCPMSYFYTYPARIPIRPARCATHGRADSYGGAGCTKADRVGTCRAASGSWPQQWADVSDLAAQRRIVDEMVGDDEQHDQSHHDQRILESTEPAPAGRGHLGWRGRRGRAKDGAGALTPPRG